MHDENVTKKKVPGWLLPLLMVAGASLGFLIGGLWGDHWVTGDWPVFTGFLTLLGDIFMNLLKMIVVPLIVSAMIVGIAGLSEHRKVGRTFGYTFTYYLITTIISVTIGLILVVLIEPGADAKTVTDASLAITEAKAWYDALFDMIRGLVPPNLFAAASQGQIIGLLVFSLVFGWVLVLLGERGKKLVALIETVQDAFMVLVRWVVWLAPVGIIGLVATHVGRAGGGAVVWEKLGIVSVYFATVLLGLAIHAFVVLPLLLFVTTGRNPFRQLAHFAEALVMAFSTASSAASLPITIRCAEKNAKLSPRTAGFVLPLGATINMDGTALYEAVAAVFIAQAFGVELSGIQLIIVLLTATLAAVGAAAIPQAGLVTMTMVLTAIGAPLEGIGLLLSVDWLLDRFRTTVNVWGDSVGATIIDTRTS